MKSLLIATALLAAVATATAPMMAGVPQRPSADKFVHYRYADESMTTLKRDATISSVFNPEMKFGGASIDNREDGMGNAGWDQTYVMTEAAFTQEHTDKAFYAAGFAEGAETQHRMYQNFVNIFPNTDTLAWDIQCDILCQAYITSQRTWMKTQAAAKIKSAKTTASEMKYWKSVQNSVHQIQGLIDGYQSVITGESHEFLTEMQIYLIGFDFELFDVQNGVTLKAAAAANTTTAPKPELADVQLPAAAGRNQHCSALIKVTDDELFMAHDTWSGFNTMLRQYKTYEFGNSSNIPTIAMSSYPGTLHSGDDWYMLSNGLTTQETTNGNFNETSKSLIKFETVPEFVRVMVANRLAVDGESWTKTFCQENSGTYNNQYMVVNHNLFNATASAASLKTPPGTLWIVEQMPTQCVFKDETDHLVKNSYWASYNIPALLFKEMNYPAAVQKFGSFFSYTDYARPEIFAAYQGNITDLKGMKDMMRWNDYENSKFSLIPADNCDKTTSGKCTPAYSPTLAIANRGDLAPVLTNETGGPLYTYLTRSAFGAIDSKIVSSKDIKKMIGHLISGPTSTPYSTGNIAPFNWTTSGFTGLDNNHVGMPDLFDFDYYTSEELVGNIIYHKSTIAPATDVNKSTIAPATDVNSRYHGKFAPYQGFLIAVLLAVIGLAAYIYTSKKNAGDEYNPMSGQ